MGIKLWHSEKSDFDAQSKTAVLGHYLTMTDKRENSSTYTFSYSPHTVGAYAVNYSTPTQTVIGQQYSWDSKGNQTETDIMGWNRTKTEGMDLDLVYNGKSTYTRYTESATDYLNDVNAYIALVKTISSVTAPAGITVESGTDPKASAPSTVSVTYSDGTTGTANVTWDDSNATWKNRKGGSYTMSGTVHDSVANKDLSTSIAVTVKPAGIKVANTSSSTNLTVDPGTDLSTVLPTLTSITYTNGETVPGGTLKWSIPDGATNGQHLKSTDFSVPGEVYDADGVDTKQTVNANITVRPITVSTVNAVTASTTSGIAPVAAVHGYGELELRRPVHRKRDVGLHPGVLLREGRHIHGQRHREPGLRNHHEGDRHRHRAGCHPGVRGIRRHVEPLQVTLF